MVKNWWTYEVISSTAPSASFLKNPELNCEANTGHIKKLKHSTERYDLQLLDAA